MGSTTAMAISDERALENERLFRSANDRIDQRRRELEVDGRTPYLCECEDPACTQLLSLTREEYRRVRADRGQFMVARGHPTRGAPVDGWDDYLIVRKDSA
jgi:hypothetical protein